MTRYKVGIYTPNKIFMIKGRVIRSPFETEVSERDLLSIKIKIKTEGIDKYSIEELFSSPIKTLTKKQEVKKNIEQNNDKLISQPTEIKIEELEQKSKSLLNSFINS